jgi:hypothetical protein
MLLVMFPAKSGLILSSKSFFDTWNNCYWIKELLPFSQAKY